MERSRLRFDLFYWGILLVLCFGTAVYFASFLPVSIGTACAVAGLYRGLSTGTGTFSASATSQALDASVRKLSRILCDDVRATQFTLGHAS